MNHSQVLNRLDKEMLIKKEQHFSYFTTGKKKSLNILIALFLIIGTTSYAQSSDRTSEAESYKDSGDAAIVKGNVNQAIADYTKAIEINPNDGEAYNNRAVMYFGEKEYAKAKEDVCRAQALGYEVSPQLLENLSRESARSPEYQALDKGGLYSEKGMHDEAIAEFNSAIQTKPNSAEAYYFRAGAYAQKNDFDKAVSDYTKAIEINPDYGDAYYNRALTYLAKQEYNSAWQDVHKAEKLGHKIDPAFLEKLKQCSGNTSQPAVSGQKKNIKVREKYE